MSSGPRGPRIQDTHLSLARGTSQCDGGQSVGGGNPITCGLMTYVPHPFALSSHALYIIRELSALTIPMEQWRRDVRASGGAAGGTRKRSDGLDRATSRSSHAQPASGEQHVNRTCLSGKRSVLQRHVIGRMLLSGNCGSPGLIETLGPFTRYHQLDHRDARVTRMPRCGARKIRRRRHSFPP